VARAKRTDRAEARRRYRAASAAETTEAPDEPEDGPPPKARSSTSSGAPRPSNTPPRMGMAAAFRAAIRPMNLRDDLASLPWLAVHTRALWLPILIVLATTVGIVALPANALTVFMFQYFLLTPAIGGVFIAGFLAPRASWLAGVVVGLVSALCLSFLTVFFPSSIYSTVPDSAMTQELVIQALILTPLAGAFFAASAAWYRRFLALISPRPQKTATPRRGDGRTRTSGTSQKAAAKR